MLQSQINVTPLVDVCLVLLIIFMVVTPMIVSGDAIELPVTRHGAPLDETTLGVSVMHDGTVLVGSAIVREDEVPAALQHLRTTGAPDVVTVRADKRTRYGSVVSVLGACRTAGFEDVKLVSVRARD